MAARAEMLQKDDDDRLVDLDRRASEAVTEPARRSVVVYGMNYAPEIAGVGKYTGEIAEHLAAEGMDVTVVTTPPHYPGWKVQPGHANRYSSAVEAGVRVLRAPLVLRQKMKGIWRLIAPLSFAATSAPLVFWQILRRRPDTVLCVEPTLFAAPFALLAAKMTGARTVLHVQDLEVDAAFAVGHLGSKAWLKRLGYAFERSMLSRFDAVVTISNRMAETLVAKGVPESAVSVVRNWVDISHIYPTGRVSPYRAELGFGDDDFVILYSGNIGAKQGLGLLLEAASQLRDDSKLHFVIAGEGPVKAELGARYADLANVRFLPFQPYARLNDFLNMPDLHVLPQEKGAADLVLPSKVGGMLASGKQILVTADQGTELAEFLAGIAIIVPPGGVAAMASAIVRCEQERIPRLSEARDVALRHLSRDAGLKAIVDAVGASDAVVGNGVAQPK